MYPVKSTQLVIFDIFLGQQDPFVTDRAGVHYLFNYDLELVSIGTDSNYDLWAKNLYEEGRIPFIPDYEYFEAFKDSLLYWDGEEFVRVSEKF